MARSEQHTGKPSIIAVVGNPNSGKTTLFNALTGMNQRVGNWPGVTVDKKTGFFTHNGRHYELVDLPGIYSLSALSQDEEIAREFILEGQADLIINIVDASNPDRNLYLTSRLLEMKVPVLIALNMMDAAKGRGIAFDIARLSSRIGCRIVPLVASRKDGVAELKDAIEEEISLKSCKGCRVTYPACIEKSIRELSTDIRRFAEDAHYDPDWFALKLLEGDHLLESLIPVSEKDRVFGYRSEIADTLGDDPDILVADAHYRFINELSSESIRRTSEKGESLSDRIDRVVLNRFAGIPIFLAVMYLMFLFTINLGGAFIDFFDIVAGALFVDGFGELLHLSGSPEWLTAILATGLGGALQTIATFIPPIGFMFIVLSLLEDSGYMARAAYVMDRGMRAIGLPGRAFIPLLVGFGCNIPAIMSARTMSDERDRILTIMMVPFMSCGARLPVYVLFAAAFFPSGGQNLVFLLYLIGVAVAVLTGFILKSTLLKGDISPFIMEMPAYHIPTIKGVFMRVWDRLNSFLVRAGRVLVPVIMVLALMNSLGTDGTFGNEDSENSMLAETGKAIAPVFFPMGISEENWPATVGLFTGIFAKEAVVGTLNALYAGMGRTADVVEGESEESDFNLMERFGEAFRTIPENISAITGSLLDPLGISVGDVSDRAGVAEEQGVEVTIFGTMAALFDGTAGAFAYLLFVLLYFPCVAAIAAVYRETNLAWTLFAGAWTTGLAYILAVIAYQAPTYSSHPASSAAWITAMVGMLAAAVVVMYLLGSRGFRKKTGV
ncbi:MAG: Fe(2+) transporter permease subunit FeoB [Chlorobiaceae bacterium]|nr:Fe(2+) transporter permease subunit FeoB [Chlorobiaceae bacterium]NTW63246.1 Fe(2+) transporter permease subunit FeoB [Chlorobiaceae bacterium]